MKAIRAGSGWEIGGVKRGYHVHKDWIGNKFCAYHDIYGNTKRYIYFDGSIFNNWNGHQKCITQNESTVEYLETVVNGTTNGITYAL